MDVFWKVESWFGFGFWFWYRFSGHSLAQCPGFSHLKHDPLFMCWVRLSVVIVSTSMAFGSLRVVRANARMTPPLLKLLLLSCPPQIAFNILLFLHVLLYLIARLVQSSNILGLLISREILLTRVGLRTDRR